MTQADGDPLESTPPPGITIQSYVIFEKEKTSAYIQMKIKLISDGKDCYFYSLLISN
jgi:hypothetical protein